MTRSISFASGEYYHLYNRGVEKRDIFRQKSDSKRFQTLLYFANSTTPVDLKLQGPTLYDGDLPSKKGALVDVCAYVLMPNHFHVLVKARSDLGISHFMQKLGTGYTMYFNKRYERTGVLFQGKFKAQHVADDTYLRYLVSYIHLNPVKIIEPKWKETGIKNRSGALDYLERYPYSSYLDYRGVVRKESKIVNTHALPEYCESPGDFKTAVSDWLSYDPS